MLAAEPIWSACLPIANVWSAISRTTLLAFQVRPMESQSVSAIQQRQRAAGEGADERLEKIEAQPPGSEPGDLLAPIRATTDLHGHRERLHQRISGDGRPPHEFGKPRDPERDSLTFIQG
jgi:hypothetical protein